MNPRPFSNSLEMESMLRATAGAGVLIAATAYARLAYAGRIYPFSPYVLVKDDDGAHNILGYTPERAAIWYAPSGQRLEHFAVDAKDYVKRWATQKAEWASESPSKFNCCPVSLSLWPTAVDYYVDMVIGTDSRCLYVKGKWYGDKYVESVIMDTIAESE